MWLSEVSSEYDALLEQVGDLRETEVALADVRQGVGALRASAARVHSELAKPHQKIAARTLQLARLHAVVALLRRATRALKLAAKLREHLPAAAKGEEDAGVAGGPRPDLPKAAQLVAEVAELLADTDVAAVDAVAAQQSFLDAAAARVHAQATASLRSGMETLSQAEVGQALQVYFNLGEMPEAVAELTRRYTVQVSQAVAGALDATAIASGGGGTGGGGLGRRAASTAQWREALWARLSASMDDMYAAVVAMWHLQRVAAKKRDPISHACFADVLAPATTDGSPPPQLAERFWRAFCETVGQHMANAHRSAGFIRDALSEGYPRLAALFDGMLERLERDTDVRGVAPAVPPGGRAQLALALAPFRDAFAQSAAERYEALVSAAFARGAAPSRAAAAKLVAGIKGEVARAQGGVAGGHAGTVGEAGGAGRDADMAVLVAAPLSQALYQLTERVEYHLSTGGETKQVAATPTASQLRNFGLVGLLEEVHLNVAATVLTALPREAAAVLAPALQSAHAAGEEALAAVFRAIVGRLEETLLGMHEAGLGDVAGGAKGAAPAVTEASKYMCDLRRQLSAFSADFVVRMLGGVGVSGGRLGGAGGVPRALAGGAHPIVGGLVLKLARRLCIFFVRHAALVRPLADAGRLRLARDIAELEAAIGDSLVAAETVGAPAKALRAFKPLIFLETAKVPDSLLLHDLPSSAVLHHLLSRAPPALRSPHAQSGISVSQYSTWMDRQADAAVGDRVRQCVDAHARTGGSGGSEVLGAIRAVLER